MDEFSFIASTLAPLAGEPGALGLKDDAALLRVPAGEQLVITKDAMSEGVHFIGDEPPALIARKLLRVNLSDLAAMGARPYGYLLALLLPASVDGAWLEGFASGLKADQAQYGMTLLGGDTTRTLGTLALSLTALGWAAEGKALTRSGAKEGDGIYVTGTLGDAALGLRIARGEAAGDGYLLERYRLPEPRLLMGQALTGIASACMDISDGLMQDLGHLCKASGVGAEIHWQKLPVSKQAQAMLEGIEPYETVLAGGDDYELLLTVPEAKLDELAAAAEYSGTRVTRIGTINSAMRVTALNGQGREIILKHKGYKHF